MKYQDYLTEHTISAESIKKFELSGDNLRLNIPIKDSSGKLHFIKSREFTGKKKFYIPTGSKTILFNTVSLKSTPKYVIITAGEIDCIRLDQEGLVAVSSTSGEGTWKKEWTDQVREIPIIILCLDNDEKGIEATKKLFLEFPTAKAVEFPIGVKDVCEFFTQHNKADFRELSKNALTEEAFITKHPEEKQQNNKKIKTSINKKNIVGMRFFHPALTINRVEQEVLVGIPESTPYFDDNDKYKISETLKIISSKNGIWELTKDEMEARNLYPTSIPSFGITEPRWSPDTTVTSKNEANSNHGDRSDYQGRGQVNPYKEVFLPIKETFEKFIDFNNSSYATLLAIWTMGTYLFPMFEAYPYLYLGGTKGSGKSKVLDILYKLVFNPISSSNASPSSLFRSIENTLATILLDEGECLTGRETNPDLRLLFNAGYKATGKVTRTNPESLKVEHFMVYSPKAIASINLLDQTLASRCISLIMLRTSNKEKGRMRVNERTLDGKVLRDVLYRWCLYHALEVAKIFDEDKDLSDLNNRANELYLPLFSIASYIDSFIPEGEVKTLPIAQQVADDSLIEEDLLDDWTLWVLEAIDAVVTDFRPYLVKDIRKSIVRARVKEEEVLDDHLNNKWIGSCLKKFGFKRGRPTNEGKTYFLKRELIESLKERYGLMPPPSTATVTMVTTDENEPKVESDYKVGDFDDFEKVEREAGEKAVYELQQKGIRQQAERDKETQGEIKINSLPGLESYGH